MEMEPYPLRFQPIFRSYIWGGRRLQSVLGKALPDDGRNYAESWEVVDHGEDQSVVANGPLEGKTLAGLIRERGDWLLGRHSETDQFPLLFKFLDCQRDLSVQVHPNDEQGTGLVPPDLGKTEAWVIMAVEPGSFLYAGLKPGVDQEGLRRHIEAGTVEQALHRIQPQPGDCVFIPAGTVHALGEGLLVAEIQQASDTTFRLFDWNRVDEDGNSRPLHIEEGFRVIDFDRGPVNVCEVQSTEKPHFERLVGCDKFVLDRAKLNAGEVTSIGGDGICHIVAVIEGSFRLNGLELRRGETVLLPAALDESVMEGCEASLLLDMYLP